MSRYKFDTRDLAPLRAILQLPVISRALAAAIPIKHFEKPARHIEVVELPVTVRSREHPDGVPLASILAAAQAESPTVRGLAVRGDRLFVTHDHAPPQAAQRRLRSLLTDRATMIKLSHARPTDEADDVGELRRVLLDENTPDADWMRAFRRYAVQRLIQEEGT